MALLRDVVGLPPALRDVAARTKLGDQAGERGVVGMAGGGEAEQRDRLAGGVVPVGVKRSRRRVAEHEAGVVELRPAVPVIGTHVLDDDPGSPWVVGGTYRFALRPVDGRWRIVAITLDTRWQTGDAGVLQRAATPSRAPR